MTLNIIFLAAGEGSRLRPHTETVPKGMVPLLNKPLIERNMAEWAMLGSCNFYFVTGYCSEIIEALGNDFVHNSEFDRTNMVWSLACAFDHIRTLKSKYIYVSYADIVVHNSALKKIVDADGSFCVHVDRKWRDLWSIRMDDYLEDVETLTHDGKRITSLGQKPTSENQVQGQFIGLMRFNRLLLVELLANYLTWVGNAESEGDVKVRKNIYMTDFIQNHINNNGKVTPVFIDGGWLEVDTIQDLKIYMRRLVKVHLFAWVARLVY